MDLIYADDKKRELGFLKNCEMDLAFGSDENDYTCTLDRKNHCCNYDYLLYVYGTEYGGIIDKISVNTGKDTVTYAGRTWHGIIEGKIICPDENSDYYSVSGDANDILRSLIEKIGLSDLFEVKDGKSGIEIGYYQFERYVAAYTGIRKMLLKHSSKLKISYYGKKVWIAAVPLLNYNQNDEIDADVLKLSITKPKRTVNHLICLGTGDLANRKVIHLFTNEYGALMPYSKTDMPQSDDDYILDTSEQVLFGKDEITDTYDFSSAGSIDNYMFLKEKPDDWTEHISSYYVFDDNGKLRELSSWEEDIYNQLEYKPNDWETNYDDYYYPQNGKYANVESVSEDIYTILSQKPNDWEANYGNYYVYNDADQSYVHVSDANEGMYIQQLEKPNDWDTNYKNYYYFSSGKATGVRSKTVYDYSDYLTAKPENWETDYGDYYYYWTDGVTEEWKSAEGRTEYRYDLQTMQPSDWDTNFKNYYYYKQCYRYIYKEWNPSHGKKAIISTEFYDKAMPTGKINSNLQRKFVKKELTFKEYTALEKRKKWKKNTYYTKVPYQVPPFFAANRYKSRSSREVAPDWVANTYYVKVIINIPTWEEGKYYVKTTNHVPTWGYGKYYRKDAITMYPEFYPDMYLQKKVDNYAELVKKGIERLEKLQETDTLSINFEPETDYDIGDIVGATEDITGVSVSQFITKKIVKLKGDTETIEYKVGE